MASEASAGVSVSDGVAIAQVRYGAQLLSECAYSLEIRASTRAQALALYNRFYLRGDARKHSTLWTACASLLLATKHDERPKRLRDVATCAHYTLVARERWEATVPLDYFGAAGHVWKSSITAAEIAILHECGFRVHTEIPHKLVLVFANTLREKAGAPDWTGRWRKLMHAAWTAANDIMLIPTCISSHIDDIACACIARAALSAGIPLPSQWMVVFGATEQGVNTVNTALDELYAAPGLNVRFEDLSEARDVLTACGVVREAKNVTELDP